LGGGGWKRGKEKKKKPQPVGLVRLGIKPVISRGQKHAKPCVWRSRDFKRGRKRVTSRKGNYYSHKGVQTVS